jgi:hypothetical protein
MAAQGRTVPLSSAGLSRLPDTRDTVTVLLGAPHP